MIDFWEEPLSPVYEQLDELLQEYFAKTIAKDGLPPLRMNWMTYIELNVRNELAVFTARSDWHSLHGFVMYHIHPHLHHMGTLCAACDILATRLGMRGNGVARKLLEYAEPRLKSRGVHFISHQFRTCYDVEPLFPKLGYKLIEHAYLKDIR